jgi:hypothetical protein
VQKIESFYPKIIKNFLGKNKSSFFSSSRCTYSIVEDKFSCCERLQSHLQGLCHRHTITIDNYWFITTIGILLPVDLLLPKDILLPINKLLPWTHKNLYLYVIVCNRNTITPLLYYYYPWILYYHRQYTTN